jgi:hypothetical protein
MNILPSSSNKSTCLSDELKSAHKRYFKAIPGNSLISFFSVEGSTGKRQNVS